MILQHGIRKRKQKYFFCYNGEHMIFTRMNVCSFVDFLIQIFPIPYRNSLNQAPQESYKPRKWKQSITQTIIVLQHHLEWQNECKPTHLQEIGRPYLELDVHKEPPETIIIEDYQSQLEETYIPYRIKDRNLIVWIKWLGREQF